MMRKIKPLGLVLRPASNLSRPRCRNPLVGSQLRSRCSTPPATQPPSRLACRNMHATPSVSRFPVASSCHSCQLRSYYTATSPPEAPYPPTETAILIAATAHIPVHGFTAHTLTLGAIDAGYLPATVNLLPRGPFDLVLYHLASCRLGLQQSVQFPDPASNEHERTLSTSEKVRSLLIYRLHANETIIHKLPEALALMSLPTNVPSSMRELALLVDEILFLSGDVDVSASWYTKRAALAGIYGSSELFMTQDQSKDFEETEKFVDRRLKDSENAAYAAGSVGQWLGFTGLSALNVLRSWGAKI